MKCFLHIGPEKTATTTIQEFLHINRAALAERDYAYYTSVGLKNQTKLAVAAYDQDRRDDLTNYAGIYSNDDLLRFQTQTIAALQDETDRLGPFKAAIFSSEHLQSRLTRNTELTRLRSLLNSLGFDDIQIIVYLRRPADIANSHYSTAIKCGHTITSPPPPDNPYIRTICDHRNTLTRFSEVFGEDAMQARLFGKDEFEHGSVISDFLHSVGLGEKASSFEIPVDMNSSLSTAGLAILRRVNERVPEFIDNRPNPLRANLVEYFSRHLGAGSPFRMSRELFLQYEEAFRESDEWVRERYFPHRTNLFRKVTYQSSTETALNQAEVENIADMIASIWLDQRTALDTLSGGKASRSGGLAGRLKRRLQRILQDWR